MPSSNKLLDRLNATDMRKLLGAMELITLRETGVIATADEVVTETYFPIDCVLSLVVANPGGDRSQVATVGPEGVFDIGSLYGRPRPRYNVFAQSSGTAWYIETTRLQDMLGALPALRELLMRYTVAELHIAQLNSLCGLRHTMEARLARWLLAYGDRSEQATVPVTQEFLSVLLGVRRQGVNGQIQELRRKGIIRTSRGAIRVLERANLEKLACPCYQLASELYEQAMSD